MDRAGNGMIENNKNKGANVKQQTNTFIRILLRKVK